MSLMDGKALLKARNEAKNGTAPAYAHYVAELASLADQHMTTGPFSVTNGSLMPPTGDRHDYISLGGYVWPPATACNASILKQVGVPTCARWCHGINNCSDSSCICNETLLSLKYPGEPCNNRWYPHSGYNGEMWARIDRLQLEAFEAAVFPLTMSWWYTQNTTYLERAVYLLRVWFLDPRTRMNPHLDYGAHEPGAFDGGPTGIVDFGHMQWIFETIRLVEFAGSPTWTAADAQGMQAWMDDFHSWFDNAPNSKLALKISNDIGTIVIQIGLSTSLFAGDRAAARFLAANQTTTMLSRLLCATGAFCRDSAAIGADSFGYHLRPTVT